MKSLTPFLMSSLLAGCLLGCDEPMQAGAAQPPAGYRIVQKVDTPGITTVETPGKEITRDVVMTRILSPFGESPGAVLMAQKPMSVGESTTPGLNMTAEGAIQSVGTQGKFIGGAGGGTWYQMLLTKLKDYALMLGGGLGILLVGGAVLYFMVPAARPIINSFLRGIASVFPVLGSAVESAVAKAKVATVQKPLEEVIDTIQDFKKRIGKEPTFTADIRDKINELLVESYAATQNDPTAAVVKKIKASV